MLELGVGSAVAIGGVLCGISALLAGASAALLTGATGGGGMLADTTGGGAMLAAPFVRSGRAKSAKRRMP